MFSYQWMAWPQCGQRERGRLRLRGGSAGSGAAEGGVAPDCSCAHWAHSAFHCCSIMRGSLCTTTLRKLPTNRPSRPPNVACIQSSKTIRDRKSTRLNSSHSQISYAVFCLKKKKKPIHNNTPFYKL